MPDSALVTEKPAIDFKLLKRKLQACKTDDELFRAIVNSPYHYRVEMAYLFLGIIALMLVDKKAGIIRRIALSETELAHEIAKISVLDYSEIKVNISDQDNLIVKAIETGKPKYTTDWSELLMPALTAEEALINQASGGIAYTAIYPLNARDGGALTFNYFQYSRGLDETQKAFMETYARLVEKQLQATS